MNILTLTISYPVKASLRHRIPMVRRLWQRRHRSGFKIRITTRQNFPMMTTKPRRWGVSNSGVCGIFFRTLEALHGSAFEYVLEAFHFLLYGVWVVAQEGIWSRWMFRLSLLGSSIIWPRGSEVGDFVSWSKLSTYCKLLFRWREA